MTKLFMIVVLTLLTFASTDVFFVKAAELKKAGELFKETKKQVHNISTEELKTILKENPETFLIDVRNRPEIRDFGGEIKALNNHNIPGSWLIHRIGNVVKKNSPIVVYCGIGIRSVYGAKTLMDMGYTNVKNYEPGFNDWNKKRLPKREMDKYPESVLYDRPLEVIKNVVYVSLGATAPATYENAGHNNNLSFVITKKGVVVFNAGASYLLAKALHAEIRKRTKQPVKYVVMENAQGHAALGMSYWHEQGVPTLMHKYALEEWKRVGPESVKRGQRIQKDKSIGTQFVLPTQTFDKKMVLDMGDEKIILRYLGKSHGPGDILLVMPKRKLVISGDFAFNERILPIFKHTYIDEWITNWKKFVDLKPTHIIPGHGAPTDMATVTRFTKDYLVFLRDSVEELLDNDGELGDIYKIDQSAYWQVDTYRELALQNLATVFKKMEFE